MLPESVLKYDSILFKTTQPGRYILQSEMKIARRPTGQQASPMYNNQDERSLIRNSPHSGPRQLWLRELIWLLLGLLALFLSLSLSLVE